MSSKSSKFERKTEPKDVAKMYANSREIQLKRMRKVLPEQSQLWTKVKGICLNNNVPTTLFSYYYAFASELYKKKSKFAGELLENEAVFCQMDWIHKGLDSKILSLIGYAMGIPLDPAIEMIVTNLLNPHPVSLSTLLNPHPVSLSTLLNPHPVSLTSIPNPSNLDVALSLIKVKTDNLDVALSTRFKPTDSIGNTSFAATQNTRASLKVQPEREDLISLGGVVSPNNAGVQIVGGTASQYIKVYDAGYEPLAAGLHYFYFGTSTTATAKRFMSRTTLAPYGKSFVHPRVGASGDGLYLFSAVSETNMPYDLGYVKEA